MREAYNNYHSHTLPKDLSENPKKFWSYVKSISGSKPTVQSLVDHSGAVIEESKRKAEVLNLTFKKFFTQEDRTNVPSFDQRTNSEMEDIVIGISGVEKQLRELNTKMSDGPDGIPVQFYKEYSAALAPYLACIYRESLIQRKVPSDWEKAQVTPVYKKGKRTDPHSYRPISLTSVSCRILEHILSSNIVNFLETEKLLSMNQHGFRKHRSYETQLALFSHDILRAMYEGQQADCVFLDFKKAFDAVPHCRLLME